MANSTSFLSFSLSLFTIYLFSAVWVFFFFLIKTIKKKRKRKRENHFSCDGEFYNSFTIYYDAIKIKCSLKIWPKGKIHQLLFMQNVKLYKRQKRHLSNKEHKIIYDSWVSCLNITHITTMLCNSYRKISHFYMLCSSNFALKVHFQYFQVKVKIIINCDCNFFFHFCYQFGCHLYFMMHTLTIWFVLNANRSFFISF